MSAILIWLTLVAALLHASWNALLRGSPDRLWSMTIMCMTIAMASVVIAVFLPLPAPVRRGYALLSALLHVGYNLCLVRSYRTGVLGQIYPVARGSSPLLVTFGAAVFAEESIALSTLSGVVLISIGIIFLAFRGRRLVIPGLYYSLATGCFIAAYTIINCIGVRQSGEPVTYTAWMCALWVVFMPVVYMRLRDTGSLFTRQPGFVTAVAGGCWPMAS